jgi:hypothetical protein
MRNLINKIIIATATVFIASATSVHAQQLQSAVADVIVPNGDYILAPGVPGCETNPFDAVHAAANVIVASQTSGWIGALTAVLDAVGRSGKVGGAVGEILQLFYGPRYARCAPVSVVIPVGSQIVRVAYEARDGSGSGPCNLDGNGWIVCGVGWSLFEPYQVTPAGNSMIVTAIFKNWSHDRERGATLTVYFIPPNGL